MKKIIGIGILVVLVAGFFVWKFVNKKSADTNNEKPAFEMSFSELATAFKEPQTALEKYKTKLIAVQGNVLSITNEDTAMTIEIGNAEQEKSVVCQMDKRHLAELKNIKEGEPITIKGILTGYSDLSDLDIPSSIEMNFCNLKK
ncbi:MAG: hypothetical protein KA275_03110 [Chitinophagaceae bacterium]|nr:hypothetical protein [Chitinophagaceae bacterium]